MNQGIQDTASGSIFLDDDLVAKYQKLPDSGKRELRSKWMKQFDYKTPRRLERIIAHDEQTIPTPDQSAWLKQMIEHYHTYYSLYAKPASSNVGATA